MIAGLSQHLRHWHDAIHILITHDQRKHSEITRHDKHGIHLVFSVTRVLQNHTG